uniref:Uncharacterized protein n=1 Tax=Lygus hesperus TaxID=30085 RepID=A0A0K8TEV0_LYGHE
MEANPLLMTIIGSVVLLDNVMARTFPLISCHRTPPYCYPYEMLVCDQYVNWLCVDRELFTYHEPKKFGFFNKPLNHPFIAYWRTETSMELPSSVEDSSGSSKLTTSLAEKKHRYENVQMPYMIKTDQLPIADSELDSEFWPENPKTFRKPHESRKSVLSTELRYPTNDARSRERRNSGITYKLRDTRDSESQPVRHKIIEGEDFFPPLSEKQINWLPHKRHSKHSAELSELLNYPEIQSEIDRDLLDLIMPITDDSPKMRHVYSGRKSSGKEDSVVGGSMDEMWREFRREEQPRRKTPFRKAMRNPKMKLNWFFDK